MNKYQATLVRVQNDNFKVADKDKKFIVNASNMDEAIRLVDKYLYSNFVIAYVSDYYIDTTYNDDTQEIEVTFGDMDINLDIVYSIEKL